MRARVNIIENLYRQGKIDHETYLNKLHELWKEFKGGIK
jgi:hypothetical protein